MAHIISGSLYPCQWVLISFFYFFLSLPMFAHYRPFMIYYNTMLSRIIDWINENQGFCEVLKYVVPSACFACGVVWRLVKRRRKRRQSRLAINGRVIGGERSAE